MDSDHHDELEGLRIRVAELEDLVQQLGQQLDGLSEHLEDRLQRHHERIEAVDDDARRRDQDLVYEVDRVCSDVSALERAGRGW
jgi:galactokinase